MSSSSATSSVLPIRWVHPRRCLIREPLTRGEVRRVPTMRRIAPPLVGYDVGCPACGRRTIWRHADDVAFSEGPTVEDRAEVDLGAGRAVLAFWRASTLLTDRPLVCPSCSQTITLEGTEIRAA